MTQSCSSMQPPDEAQQAMEQAALQASMEQIGRKLLILSGKGGVGKSTVAVNLAMALASAGRKVGLLDVDLHGPSVPTMLGLAGRRLEGDERGGIRPLEFSENLKVVSIAMFLDSHADAVIWRGPMKYSVIRQFLADVDWGRLDYLVIDSPPGTGDEPLAVAQLVGSGASAVIVTTPQGVAVADVRRSISFCRTLSLPVAGVVENMSGLVCPHCNETVELFKTGGGEALAGEMGAAFLGRVPLDPAVVSAGDDGRPFAGQSGPAADAINAIVAALDRPQPAPNTQPESRKETAPMKIAIPVAEGKLCMHFGHCQQFAIVDVAADNTVAGVQMLTPPPHEPGVLPRWLHEQGADVVIAGGMGQRAQGLFAENGIQVVVAPSEAPEAVAAAYLAGTLESGQNVCDH